MRILPEPGHEYGYTEKQIQQIMGDRYNEFIEWMFGQTMGMDENGGAIYYSWDVERFLKGLPIID